MQGKTEKGNGGVRGIRTLDTGLSRYNALAGRPLRPLGHHSGVRHGAKSRHSTLLCLPDDPVAQHADLIDLQLHDVAWLQEPGQLQAAAGAYSARGDDFARMQCLGAGDEGEDLREAVLHGARVAATPALAVDAHFHVEGLRIADLVGGDDPGAEYVAGVEVLALHWPHAERA